MNCVGVVGAGVMGVGTSHALAEAGYEVVLVDVAQDALDGVPEALRQSLSMAALLDRSRRRDSFDEVSARIESTTEYSALERADFVIENTTERIDVKEKVYPLLDRICRTDVVFAANTSAVPIERLASLTRRAPQVLGMHLMNPVPLKPTVEMIRARLTSPETLEVALELLRSMGKEGIVVNDSPGFVSNRVLMLTINEAIGVVADGVAEPSDVDRIFKSCFGHKMGPLETADLIGLDTIVDTLVVLHESYDDDKFMPHPLLKEKVDRGETGRKGGRGFYEYGSGAR